LWNLARSRAGSGVDHVIPATTPTSTTSTTGNRAGNSPDYVQGRLILILKLSRFFVLGIGDVIGKNHRLEQLTSPAPFRKVSEQNPRGFLAPALACQGAMDSQALHDLLRDVKL
jgi:hypothetical protein